MAMDEETKKKLLYGGGAIASIVAVIYLFKKPAQSNMPISAAGAGPSGSSGASSATEAAQIQSATQLAIAQGNQQIALAQIAASTQNTQTQANAAISAARLGEQGKIASAALAPGGVAQQGVKGLFDVLKEAVDGVFGKGTVSNLTGSSADPNSPNFVGPPASGAGGYSGNPNENFITPKADFWGAFFADPTLGNDYFQGTTGSGDNSYFGTSPSDPVVWTGETPTPIDWGGSGQGGLNE